MNRSPILSPTPNLTSPPPHSVILSSKLGIYHIHFAANIEKCNVKYFLREEIMNKIFMIYLRFPRTVSEMEKKTFPLFQERIMTEGKGGQLLTRQGELGLIMRGVGMFFSLDSLLFTHKKGKAKRENGY